MSGGSAIYNPVPYERELGHLKCGRIAQVERERLLFKDTVSYSVFSISSILK
jgi:hypothetical protein